MNRSERFPAFYRRDFRLLWIGQVISFSGTWMHSTAQGWLVYSLTRSPLYLGLVAAAASLPVMLFSLLGGVAADRFRKRNLLIVTQALSIVPALGVGILTQMGVIQVWQVVVFVLFLGTVNSFDVPARQSFFAEIVEKGHLVSAIALNSAAFNGARIIGPVIAGLTIAYVGLPACFYLNALSFLAVIGALARIQSSGAPPTYKGKGFVRELGEGMRFIKGEPAIRILLALTASFSLFAIPFVTLLPVFAAEILKVGAKGLGFLAGSAGLGAFAAAMALAYRGKVSRQLRFMKTTAVVFPAALFMFSFSLNFYVSAAMLALAGWSLVSFLALANSTIQLRCGDSLRGRVMSAYTLVFLGLAPVGNLILGALADLFGTPEALRAASILCASLSVFLGNRLNGLDS
jgi:MFS family permease